MVAVGVAVQDEVVGAVPEPEADRLPVVHFQLFVDVVVALVVEADRLGVAGDGDLHAGDGDAAKVQP